MVTPTLFVGLGGAGLQMIVGVHKLLQQRPDYNERYRSLNKFLGIDTNADDIEQNRPDLDANILISDFDKAEYARLASGMTYESADPYFTQWVPKDYRFRNGDTAGAGQIRIESRLGLYYQTKHGAVLPEIQRLLSQMMSHEGGQRRINREIRIVLCFGLAGGTGSGSNLAMAYLLQEEALRYGSPWIIGVAVMPGVVEHKVGGNLEGINANSYAALKEIEHLMKLGAPQSLFYGEPWRTFHFNPARPERNRVETKPYEFVYLIDNPSAISVSDPGKAAAAGLYLQLFSPIINQQKAHYDNFTQHQRALVPAHFAEKNICGFTTFYGTFGAAVLHVPWQDLTEYCATRLAVASLGTAFMAEPDPVLLKASFDVRHNFAHLKRSDNGKDYTLTVDDIRRNPDREDRARQLDDLFMSRIRIAAAATINIDNNSESNDKPIDRRYLNYFINSHPKSMSPTQDGKVERRPDNSPLNAADETQMLGDKLFKRFIHEQTTDGKWWDPLDGSPPEDFNFAPTLLRHLEQYCEKALSEAQKDAIDAGETAEQARKDEEESKKGLLSSFLPSPHPSNPSSASSPEGQAHLIDNTESTCQEYVEAILKKQEDAGDNDLSFRNLQDLREFFLKETDVLQVRATCIVLHRAAGHLKKFLDDPTKTSKDVETVNVLEKKKTDAMARLKKLIRHLYSIELGRLLQNLEEYLSAFRDADLQLPRFAAEQVAYVEKLRQQGGPACNQYILDVEALQIETGRRMWDYFYTDRILGNNDLLTSNVVNNQLRRHRASVARGRLDDVFNGLKEHAAANIRTELRGDPHSPDELRRLGLCLDDAINLEIDYRKFYLSSIETVDAGGPDAETAIHKALSARTAGNVHEPEQQPKIDEDYFRTKFKQLIIIKANLLSSIDESATRAGGVIPAHCHYAVLHPRFLNTPMARAIADTDKGLQFHSNGWDSAQEIIVYRSVLNVPLYVFPRLRDMKYRYRRFRNATRPPRVLHIDTTWDGDNLPDLDPQDSRDANEERVKLHNIIDFASLLIATPSDGSSRWGLEKNNKEGGYDLRSRHADPSVQQQDSGVDLPTNDLVVRLGSSIGTAVTRLPGVLTENAQAFYDANQLAALVRGGGRPDLLIKVIELPTNWRRLAETLRNHNPAGADQGRGGLINDFKRSALQLAAALQTLLSTLQWEVTMSSQTRSLGGATPTAEVTATEIALRQSVTILETFRDRWERIDDAQRPQASLGAHFKPMGADQLNRALGTVRGDSGKSQ
jgi:hypothetical protein